MRTGFLGARLVVCAAAPGAAPLPAIAIRGARVVAVSGPVREGGTVFVRNGLVEAAGVRAISALSRRPIRNA